MVDVFLFLLHFNKKDHYDLLVLLTQNTWTESFSLFYGLNLFYRVLWVKRCDYMVMSWQVETPVQKQKLAMAHLCCFNLVRMTILWHNCLWEPGWLLAHKFKFKNKDLNGVYINKRRWLDTRIIEMYRKLLACFGCS